jgi:hypothetical protein
MANRITPAKCFAASGICLAIAGGLLLPADVFLTILLIGVPLVLAGALLGVLLYAMIVDAFERGREATEDPERAALREYLDGEDDFNG